MKSLIIEDDIMTNETLGFFLLNYGPSDGVYDGIDGLEYFRNALIDHDPYNIVILDFDLPVMDGLEIIQELKKMEREMKLSTGVKIILISGVEGIEKMQTNHSWDSFIKKPFHKSDIISEIDRLMNHAQLY